MRCESTAVYFAPPVVSTSTCKTTERLAHCHFLWLLPCQGVNRKLNKHRITHLDLWAPCLYHAQIADSSMAHLAAKDINVREEPRPAGRHGLQRPEDVMGQCTDAKRVAADGPCGVSHALLRTCAHGTLLKGLHESDAINKQRAKLASIPTCETGLASRDMSASTHPSSLRV